MYRDDYDPHDCNTRTKFLAGSCKTTAYPSMGGLVLGHFSPPELDYLALSRMTPANRSSSPADEDDLAARMLGLGANWWPSWNFYSRHRERISELIPYDYHFPPVVHVGIPQGSHGVWVFKHSADEQTFDAKHPRKPYLDREPDDWEGRIRMAMSMDERCQVIKDFGGMHFETAEDCPDISTSLQEGVDRGQRHQALMERLDDWAYIDKWLNGE